MASELVEKTVTVTDPRDGSPLAITVNLELSAPVCGCDCAQRPSRRPIGYGSSY